jgi:hypothetical protein
MAKGMMDLQGIMANTEEAMNVTYLSLPLHNVEHNNNTPDTTDHRPHMD